MQAPIRDPEHDAGATPSPQDEPGTSGLGQGAWRMARRVGVAIVGSVVLAVGLILLVTPGPAFVVIPIGLGILSLEFEWARRWLREVKRRIGDVLPHGERERVRVRSGDAGSAPR
jgi:uncharacterized protein (TIGR02611 family)